MKCFSTSRAFFAVLVFLLMLARCAPVNAYPSVTIYTHGFATQIIWTSRGHIIVNQTSSVLQNQPLLWAYLTAALYNVSFTWQWYDPSGQLYYNQTQQEQCIASPCTFVTYLPINGTLASTKFGIWRLNLLADGFKIYSDFFTLVPIITQNDTWTFNVTQSSPLRMHGTLLVTIHPDNQTWRYYKIYMPYATNITATEPSNNESLGVMQVSGSGQVIVNLKTPRPDGFTFQINFNVKWGLANLNGVSYTYTWQDAPWDRSFDVHPIPESFNITLPLGSIFTDAVGMNVMVLNYNITDANLTSISFATVLQPWQTFGWSIIYQDSTWLLSQSKTITTQTGVILASQQAVPIFPITVGDVSLWSAVMSVLLLTGSELLSPVYGKTGIIVDRRRMRIAALILVTIFLIATAYQLLAPHLLTVH